jgi:hypothetical protein
MIAVAIESVLVALMLPTWRAIMEPVQHSHKHVRHYHGTHTTSSGQVLRGNIISVCEDGCWTAD